MAVRVREKSIAEIQEKLNSFNTELNKIIYLESALKDPGFSYDIKRFILEKLAEFYVQRKMFDRAAKAMASKASVDVLVKDKVNSYLSSAEFYAHAGKIDDADEMFVRAGRDADATQRERIKLTRKNLYLVSARELEKKGKRANATKFYEKLVRMNLEGSEKDDIKKKLVSTYHALGLFREAKLVEGL